MDGGLRAGKDHLAKLPGRVFFPVLVVAQTSPAGDHADDLLAEQTGADFDGHAYDHRSVGRDEPAKVLQDSVAHLVDAMFEHLHAENDAKTFVVVDAGQLLRKNERQPGHGSESAYTIGGLFRIQIGPDRLWKQVVNQ